MALPNGTALINGSASVDTCGQLRDKVEKFSAKRFELEEGSLVKSGLQETKSCRPTPVAIDVYHGKESDLDWKNSMNNTD